MKETENRRERERERGEREREREMYGMLAIISLGTVTVGSRLSTWGERERGSRCMG